MVVAILDADNLIYKAGCKGEERTIEVTHTPSGRVQSFKNRTEFWGHHKKKEGGWLGDLNKERLEKGLSTFHPTDFEITDKQEVVEDVANVLHTVKMKIASQVEEIGADSMVCFLGGSEPLYRWEQSTMQEYKGSRKNVLRPLLKDEIIQYLVKHQNAILCNDKLEADDWCIIEAFRVYGEGDTAIVCSPDKDTLAQPVLSYNPDKPDLGIQDGDCFGRIFLDKKGEVRGVGRIFKYYQCLYGDDADDYRADAQSEIEWGSKSAYNALKDVQNDRDAWKLLHDTYHVLYPEPKLITTWRGDEIEINALHCMQEIFNMAHMRRTPDDIIDIRQVLKKYKII